jgi:putative copper resistance protein D
MDWQHDIQPVRGVSCADKVAWEHKNSCRQRLIMKYFSPFSWISLLVLIATGIYAAVDKGDKFETWSSGPSVVLIIKLVLVAILIIILLLQQFVYGPRMKKLLALSTTKDTKNETEMMKLEKTTKPMSWWHMTSGLLWLYSRSSFPSF